MKREIEFNVDEAKEYIFSLCSDIPYERTNKEFGTYNEVLTINADSVDFSRLNSGACAFLKDHDPEVVLGVITKAWIEDNKVKCKVKFSDRDEVQKYVKDIEDGIMTCTSVGYDISDYHFENRDNKKTMIVDKFIIYEGSLVGIPADITVGYNRSLDRNKEMKKDENINEDENKISEATVENSGEAGVIIDGGENKAEVTGNAETEVVEEAKVDETKAECTEEAAEEVEEIKADEENEDEEIESLGEITGNEELAEEFIKSKKSLNDFKKALKEKKKVDLKETKKMENKKFSLRKAILNACGKITDEEAALERSISEENKTRMKNTQGTFVVTKEQLRAMPDGSETLNQTTYRPDLYTENLRPQTVISKTGCTVVPVDGADISFSVATSGLNAGFVDLNNEIPSATMAWELKSIAPKKLGCYVDVSYKALLQDRPEIEGIIYNDITKALDQCKDEAILYGNGTNNKPTGIYFTTGVNEVSLPATWTLSTAFAFEKPIRDANDFSDGLAWVMNSQMYYKLATTPKSATELNEFLIGEDHKMIGYPCYISNALPTSGIILGNFEEVLVAEYEGMELNTVTDATLSRKQAVEVQAFEAMNCLVRRPKSFTKGK